jgi:iron(III) transport system permease protein
VAVADPISWTFWESLANGGAGVRRALSDDHWLRVLEDTARLAVISAVVAVIVGSLLAWFAHRLPPRRRWLGLFPIAPIFIPGVALATGWAFLLSPRVGYLNSLMRAAIPFLGHDSGPIDVYTLPWIGLLTGITASGFVYLFVRSALSQLHQELLDAAAVGGASSIRVFFSIVLPLIRPSLIYGAATTLLLGIGQVTMPLFLGRQVGVDVLSTAMYQHMSTSPVDFGAASAFGLPIVISGLLLLALQRVAVGDQSRYVTVGSRAAAPISHTGRLGQVVVIAFGVFTTGLPLVALAYVSLSPYWTADVSIHGLTDKYYRQVISTDGSFDAMKNTALFTVATVVVALTIAYACARSIYSRRGVVGAAQDVVVSLPLGIPGVIFGLGFLLAYTYPPLVQLHIYGSPLSMVIVYVVVVLPFATRIQLAAMAHVGTELSDAGAVFGAGWLRRLASIELPLIRPSLGYAAGLIVALIAQEFSASIMVRTPSTQVMSTALYDAWAFSSYPVAAVFAIAMCAMTALGVFLAFALGGRSALDGQAHA